jgi:hypothetical protein
MSPLQPHEVSWALRQWLRDQLGIDLVALRAGDLPF